MVKDVFLQLEADFERHVLKGSATLTLEKVDPKTTEVVSHYLRLNRSEVELACCHGLIELVIAGLGLQWFKCGQCDLWGGDVAIHGGWEAWIPGIGDCDWIAQIQ